MRRTYIGNLRGPRGFSATGAAEDDTAIGEFIADAGTDSYAAVIGAVSGALGRDLADYSFNASDVTLGKWRDALILAAGGERQARVVVHGDSSPQGAGALSPYVTSSWPGRLSRLFSEKYGTAGPGALPLWHYYGTSGAALNQPGIRFAGTVANADFGVYGRGAKKVTKSGTSSFIDVGPFFCDTFRIFGLNGAGTSTGRAYIDGVDVGTFKGNVSTTGTTFPSKSGYATGGGGGQIVTDIPAGALGWHTLRMRPDGTDGVEGYYVMVEPLVTGGGVAVSNVALAGITTEQLYLDDNVIGNSGMSVGFDATRGDLHIIQCETNDWQAHTSIATFKSRLTTAVRRAKTATPVANGGTTSNGDCLIVLNQWVDTVAYPPDHVNSPAFTEYLAAATEVAVAEGAAGVDLTKLAADSVAWNAAGMAADGLHPSSRGHEAIASAVFRVLDRF